ncbi:unnamed protein product [Owenia fusiformis]|uniref:Uncharacterized protein n=1 Tax=Owenia fusiformis TaxID=6347 RepID=A0A8J1XFN2_OWEFU|nr:unnamed protein product [Owenia fusiformis]
MDVEKIRFTAESFIILLLTIGTIASNIIILLIYFRTDALVSMNKFFFGSLIFCDLFFGLFVTPFSFWTSMFDEWLYGPVFCHIEAYVITALWIASLYSLMWISIDHHMAIRKPQRYENMLGSVRSLCWMLTIWVVAICFCCPPLFGMQRATYYPEAYICLLDWNTGTAFLVTACLIVFIPPFVVLLWCHLYMLTKGYAQKRQTFEKGADFQALSRPQQYSVSLAFSITNLIIWLPWLLLQFYDVIDHHRQNYSPTWHFATMWLVLGNSFWKFLVYLGVSPSFRQGLKMLCKTWCRETEVS